MNIFDWFFKQVVTQSQMDWAFGAAQDSIQTATSDIDSLGILDGLTVQQHAAIPDLSVDVVGPGVAYDPEGQRVYVGDALTVVDCSQDEFGTSTDPPTPTFERYLSVFIRFERNLTEPMLDGNNITVYTKQLESFEFFVRMGAEAAAGTAVPPPLMTDAVLLTDILVTSGFTAILNADLDATRREDWIRFLGASIGSHVYGTPRAAVDGILTLIDAWAGSLPFSFTSTWFGAAPVLGVAPPPTTMQTALDAIVYDIAQAGAGPSGSNYIGVTDSGAFPGGFVTPWVAASLQAVLMSLGTDLDAHIGGGAPQHPASAITFTPYSWIAAVQMQLVIQEIVDDLADITATSGASRIGNDAYSWIGSTTLRLQIQEIVDDLAATGAGVSGASRIGTAAIAGTPESEPASNVYSVLRNFIGHINDRTERNTDEVVPGAWNFQNSDSLVNSVRESNNAKFSNNPLFKSIQGGSSCPYQQRGNIASGTFPAGTSWAQPWGGGNSFAFGGGAALQDIKMVYTAAGDRRIVVANDTGFGLVLVDPMAPTVFTAINLAGFFPAATYSIEAICTDEHYIYVRVMNTGTNAHYINAIDSSGVLRAGWPATGTAMTGTGGTPLGQAHTSNICVATMDINEQYAAKLATLNDWQNATTGLMVSIIDATNGAILASGDGDAVGASSPAIAFPQGGLCSDGTNIFFTWHESGAATNGGLASATIANPAVGSGLTGFVFEFPVVDSNCVVFDGDALWWLTWAGDVLIYRLAEQAIDLKNGLGTGGWKFMAFDGLNMWLQEREAVNNSILIHGIPAAEVTAVGTGTQNVATMERSRAGMVGLAEATAGIPFNQLGRMCFDGDSVWMIMNNVSGGTLSGTVRKLPRAGIR